MGTFLELERSSSSAWGSAMLRDAALQFCRPFLAPLTALCVLLPKQHLHRHIGPKAPRNLVLCENMPAYLFQRGLMQPEMLPRKLYILNKAPKTQGKINLLFLLMEFKTRVRLHQHETY